MPFLPWSFLLSSAVSLQGPATPVPVSLEHLDLTVHLNFDRRTLEGTARLRLRNVTDSALRTVPVLLNRLMDIRTASDQGGTPLDVHQDIVRFPDFSALQVNTASIQLADPLPPGATIELIVEYDGHLAPYAETGMSYIRETVDPAYTLLRADAYAFPLPGVPLLASLRATPQRPFTSHVRVVAPDSLSVASGGRLLGIESSGKDRTWEFISETPAPYLIVAVAPFRFLTRSGMRLAYLPEDSAGATRVADRATLAMEALTRWFGPLPRAPAFSLIEIPEGWGSQASLAGGIIQTRAAFRAPGRLQELYHELSHFWNAVDRDLPSARWNEGLASWLQGRLATLLDGARGDSIRAASYHALRRRVTRNPRLRMVPLAAYGREEMTDEAYRTGAVFFALVARVMGETQFDAGYRAFLRDAFAAGATLEALLASLQSVADGRDLGPLFMDWVYTANWTARTSAIPDFEDLVVHYGGTRGTQPSSGVGAS